jgi:hypothetical protein
MGAWLRPVVERIMADTLLGVTCEWWWFMKLNCLLIAWLIHVHFLLHSVIVICSI